MGQEGMSTSGKMSIPEARKGGLLEWVMRCDFLQIERITI
jgi:hypothetical protein